MNRHNPPRIAAWMLDLLGYTRENLALAGDLLEEMENGRSAAWYWRQAVIIIACGIRRNAVRKRADLTVRTAAFAAQAIVSYALWGAYVPKRVHGFGPVAAAVLLLLCGFAVREAIHRRLPSIGLYTFTGYLIAYCLCALFVRHLTFFELAQVQLTWLMFELAPVLLRVPAARPVPALLQDWPAPEPTLPVTLSDGRTILLHSDTVAQDLFTSGDEKLIQSLFAQGASLESIRQRLWSAAARHYLNVLRKSSGN